MAVASNKSVVAIVTESTEGTPIAPTSASQYIRVEEGYEVVPAIDVLESAFLTGSIGASKPILGLENPTATIDHYLNSSGNEGDEPEYGPMLHSAFGDKSVASTQYDTVGGSTAGTSSVAATIVVDTGEGATFERGEALLIKDATNGYRIRCIKSISSDTLTLNFNLPTAPSSGVNLGKASLYKPGESHPTMSLWDYRANGGAVQLVSGARVSEMGVEANAGELLNSSFSMVGVKSYYNPVEITSADRYIDFNETGPTLRAASIAAGMYDNPHQVAAALQTAMNDVATDAITVTYSDSTGKYTIASGGTLLQLLWSTGANTANTIGDKIGFVTASDDTGFTTYTSDNAYTLTSPQTPSYDSTDPFVVKYNEVMVGDFDDYVCFSTRSLSVTLSNDIASILDICSESGKSGNLATKRNVSIELVANLPVYDADKFNRFKNNTQTTFQFSFGQKSGGNWIPGKCGAIYLPTATISAFQLSDEDGQVTLNMTLTAYTDGGLGEVYLNFL